MKQASKIRCWLIAILLVCVNATWGQEAKHYCEMKCSWSFKGDCIIYLDFGDVRNPFDVRNDCEVIDSAGKARRFQTDISALNWMYQRGWNLVQYKYHTDSPPASFYLLSKECTEERLKEGVVLSRDYKREK